jgi:hypothetical protein
LKRPKAKRRFRAVGDRFHDHSPGTPAVDYGSTHPDGKSAFL